MKQFNPQWPFDMVPVSLVTGEEISEEEAQLLRIEHPNRKMSILVLKQGTTLFNAYTFGVWDLEENNASYKKYQDSFKSSSA